MKTEPGSFKKSRILQQCLAVVIAATMLMVTVPILPGMDWKAQAADELAGKTVQPVLVVSGQGIINGGAYSVANIVYEKSYTLDELKRLEEITQLYTAINTTPTKSIYRGKGISIDKLLQEANVSYGQYATSEINAVSSDGYMVRFDPAKTGDSATRGKPLKTPAFNVNRYYYPNLKKLLADVDDSGFYTHSNDETASIGGEVAKTILAWERGGDRGYPEIVPPTTAYLYADEAPLLLMVGQQNVWEMNNPLFNKAVNKILVGDAVKETVITIDGKARTRSEILMMPRAERSYTYNSGSRTDYVRGVPLAFLLSAYDADDRVGFTTAEDSPAGGFKITVGDLLSGNYILAYAKGSSSVNLAGIYDTAQNNDSICGCFTLYGEGREPVSLINSITVTPVSVIDFANSSYKHITNGGISGQSGPYDSEAIIDSVLTIEGSGVTASVSLALRELEGQNAGACRGIYADKKDGAECSRQYEGIRLAYIINGMSSGDNGIKISSDASKVLIKNRLNQTIAEFTLQEIADAEAAAKPILIAYGTGTTDGAAVAPFVIDQSDGYQAALDNDDGPVKLVYDKTAFASDSNPSYTQFANVGYICVEKPSVAEKPGEGTEVVPGVYDLMIEGPGVSKTTYYTLAQLKSAAGIETASYNWLNSYGTTDRDTFTGIYLENLLEDMAGLTASARSVTVTGSDGFERSFNLDSDDLGIYWTDIQGNKIMLAWQKNGSPCDLQLAVGQTEEKHVNRPMWVSNIKDITVNDYATTSGEGTQGSYEGQVKKIEEVIPKTDEIIVITTVTGNTASSSVSVADVNKALEEIKKTNNTEANKRKSIVDFKVLSGTPAGQVTKAQVTLPADSINALVKEENVTAKIKTDLGEIILSAEVLKQLASQSTKPVVISLMLYNESVLDDGAKAQIGARPIVDITINQGDQEIVSLAGNQIKAGIAYAATTTENQNQLLVYYINDKGQSMPVKMSAFDAENGQMQFGTVHLSLYAVGYNEVSFDDIENHWARDDIEFLAAREILKGKAAGIFDPDGQVTRAEFVTMLANSMDGINVKGSGNAGFADVKVGDWYADYVNWAVATGIASGYGEQRFAPNDLITREQMALMTDNFIQAMKANLDIINNQSSFTDQARINTWSAEAVSRMQQIGLVNGNPEGTFAPQGTATRAEAATVLKSFIEALLK